MIWKVKETPMFPNSWKVFPSGKYREENSHIHYFPSKQDAEGEAKRRNQRESLKSKTDQVS
jgi:hypothetical protein